LPRRLIDELHLHDEVGCERRAGTEPPDNRRH
jgi:hypothetical protein